jgi:hypothetical protein
VSIPYDTAVALVSLYGPLATRNWCRHHGGIDWTTAPLGRIGDLPIARAVGYVHGDPVTRARIGLHCPRAIEDGRKRAWKPRVVVDWDAQPYGLLYDREIAEATGTSKHAVASQRRKRGIAPKPIAEAIAARDARLRERR